jgi:small subunit ribosomal protein S6
MNKYESVIIINPNVDEAGVKALEDKFTGLINENGKVESVDESMGKRKLAYEIKKCKEGTYVIFNFESKPEAIAELERVYRITDDIIKYIVVKKD